jgi:putative ABC transport system permease protein
VVRLAVAQLRFRPGRSVALLLVLVTTVACFALVGSSAKTEQASVQGTLQATSRAAYDLLVRPAGAVTEAERRGNLVSSTAMSGIDGGITLQQWHQIEQIPGVYAAAPVAVVGYDYLQYYVEVHVPDPAPGQSQVLYRLAPTFTSENGLTRIPSEDEYTYITASPLVNSRQQPAPAIVRPDGSLLSICQVSLDIAQAQIQYVPACGSTSRDDTWNSPSAANPYATGPATGPFAAGPTGVQGVVWNFPFLVEAIDPVQEARLDGLDHAITAGSYLSPAAAPVTYSEARPDAQTRKITYCGVIFASRELPAGTRCTWTSVPVLAADASPLQESLQVAVERMPQSAAALVGEGDDSDMLSLELPGTAAVARTGTVTMTAGQAYHQLLAQLASKDPPQDGGGGYDSVAWNSIDFATLMTAAPISYTSHGGTQVPRAVSLTQVLSGSALPSGMAADPPSVGEMYPELADTAVRSVAWHGVTLSPYAPDKPPGGINGWDNDPQLDLVGTFDPGKVSDGSSGLSAVPMQTYFPDTAAGADAASVKALGGKPLRPNGDIAGLLSVSPSLLTTISSLPELESGDTFSGAGINAAAPISVIRVKLTGQIGLDAASQARLRLVATEIYQRTGLHVDITEGSSPASVTVTDPAGQFGRPRLELTELWSRIGASEAISVAIDAKTRLLTVLVLLLGTVFTGSAVAASVRARRPELAVLACTGWPARSLAGLILAECALLGAAAGAGGAVLAAVISPLTGTRFGLGTYAGIAALAVLLTCLAGIYPALQAARSHPGAATAQIPGRNGRRRSRTGARTLTRMAAANILRVPGRSLLAAAGVALAVAGLTLIAVLVTAFHGQTAGTLLGQAIIVQVHAADYLAAGICAVLGLALAGDIAYTATRDRAGEHALLRATGWTDADLTRLAGLETALTATAGAVTGTVLPVAGVWAATGAAPAAAITAAAAIAITGILATMLTALLPARRLMRTAPARHLAET